MLYYAESYFLEIDFCVTVVSSSKKVLLKLNTLFSAYVSIDNFSHNFIHSQ